MTKKVFAVLFLVLFTGATALASATPAHNADSRNNLLRSSAQHSKIAIKNVEDAHPRKAQKQISLHTNAQAPTSTGSPQQSGVHNTEVLSATVIKDPHQTPETAPVESPQPPLPKPIPPQVDDCLDPPPRYLLSTTDTEQNWTVPEICKVDMPPYPLPPTCPDHWIEDRMPGPIERKPYERQYFIIDGKRVELQDVDLDWILIYCPIAIEYVY